MEPSAGVNSWSKGIDTITLFVDDLRSSKLFYSMVFNLPFVYEDNDASVIKLGKTLINLLKITAAGELIEPASVGNRESGSRCVFTINVDDVDAICSELTARGVKLLNGPMDRSWGVRTASFQDPDGHIWEIAQKQAF
jgi:catechol 2,3-dioxygenase-like lactoylglutathione lyase family enzyme